MARNGSGVYTFPSNSFNPAVDNTVIDSSDWNDVVADIETEISNSVAADGQTTTTATIPFAAGLTTRDVLATSNDSGAIGASGTAFSDIFLASGAVINFAAGNYSMTHSTGALAFSGLVDISGASAGQIKFPATQNASSNANTLDDYEEGTFTPTLGGSSADGSHTYNGQYGEYTKVGRNVTIKVHLDIGTKDVTLSGDVRIKGLPFTTNSTAKSWAALACWWENIDLGTNTAMSVYTEVNTTYANVENCGDNTAAAAVDGSTGIGNGSALIVSGTYTV